MACSNWDELSNPTFSFNSHQNWFRRPRSLFPDRHSTSRCHWHHSHLDLQISRPGRNMSGAVILCDWFTPKHWQNWSLWSTQWILDYVNHFKTYMTPWDSTFFNCYNDFVGRNISFNVQSVLIEICDSLDVYVRCWGTILKNIQLNKSVQIDISTHGYSLIARWTKTVTIIEIPWQVKGFQGGKGLYRNPSYRLSVKASMGNQ